MTARRPGPVERVRTAVAREHGAAIARELPDRYQRLGSVLLVVLPEGARPAFPTIARAYREVLGVAAVLRRTGPVAGEWRRPAVERLDDGPTETTVLEHGIRFRFDAARILFARGNREERHRFGLLVRPGERIVDLFAGIGYFTLPALITGGAAHAVAVEKNPESFRYLEENLRRAGVAGRVDARLGDNRSVRIPEGDADRVVLGYLPSSRPWVARALPLLRTTGGTLHVHLVVDACRGAVSGGEVVRDALRRAGATVDAIGARRVKAYGPGREHVVVDARVRPPTGSAPGDVP